MAKINICGGLGLAKPEEQEFLRLLAREVMRQGPMLLNGCRNELDKFIARSAFDYCNENGINLKDRIKSYVADGAVPVHEYGTIMIQVIRLG